DGLTAVSLEDFTGALDDLRGLRVLEEIDEVAIVAIPDSVFPGTPVTPPKPIPVDPCAKPPKQPPQTADDDPTAEVTALTHLESVELQQAMIEHCSRLRYRVAVLDPPANRQIVEMQGWPELQGLLTQNSKFAAIYYPWLKVPDALQMDGPNRHVPPSGHVAGGYAYNDLNFGVQKPPANLALDFVNDVVQPISDLQQEGLNYNNVNAIRA